MLVCVVECIERSSTGTANLFIQIQIRLHKLWWYKFNTLMVVDTFMCHNAIVLKCQMTHLGVIAEHAKFELFPGSTKLEQQLPLQGSCSNARLFTRRAYLIFSSAAQGIIKWYHAGTIFLNKSSCPRLRAWVYT